MQAVLTDWSLAASWFRLFRTSRLMLWRSEDCQEVGVAIKGSSCDCKRQTWVWALLVLVTRRSQLGQQKF
jgi:hypothetical protein